MLSGQTNFRQLIENADPIPSDTILEIEAKLKIHQVFLNKAYTENDLLNQLFGNIYLFYDNIEAQDYIEAEKYLLEAKKIAETNGVKTAMTFSDPSMVKYFRNEMIEVIGTGVDLLFCNEEEAMLFTEKNTVEEAREALKQTAKRFVITQGKNGAMIFDGDTFIDIEPYKVDAIDSNGAGDMFAGAFMFAITNGHSYAEAGKLASLASSKIVSQFGPRLEASQAKEILTHLTA